MFNLKRKVSFIVISMALAGAASQASAQVAMGGPAHPQGQAAQVPAEVMADQQAMQAQMPAFGAPARPASSAARQLGAINEEIAVLSARLNKLKLEADIAAKLREIEEKSGEDDAASRKAAEQAAVMDKQAEAEVIPPAIHSIEGVDGNLYATLIFSGGMNQIVQKGEVIKDGWKVVGLTSSSVTLSRAGKETRLGFGLPAAASPERAASVGFPGGAPGFGGPVFQ